ncbi:MAG: vitamin B6 photo-protection and homoeostasis-domain-containing protein [Linnemannia gamsii]|nr:MAG: vitamin B6 photo-protection and homoeostasis-domain-containing protein [Linnemannia gamsii]
MDAAKHLLSPQTALAVFLPKGFPDSVTPNYWPFAKWQFVHNVAGSVTAVISTQSLLFAMGLGAGSIPMAAALNWIIKDGLGQLGGVIYASFVSDKFDSEPKRFRFQATVAMQGANVLELLTPLWPGSFLVIASISNIGKNMAWLASSATRAQMNKTFALRDNLGDITGKSGSQTTAAGLVGTGLGVVIAALMSHISEDPTVLPLVPMCLTFLPFAIFNIYSNYKSSHYVTTPSLNIPRAETVFYGVMKDLVFDKEQEQSQPSGSGPREKQEKLSVAELVHKLEAIVPTPKEVAHKEVFVTSYRSPFEVGMEVEPAIHRFAGRGKGTEALDRAFRQVDLVKKEHYYMMTDVSSSRVVIWFDKKANGKDLIQGFYHACATRAIMQQGKDNSSGSGCEVSKKDEWSNAIRLAHEEAIEIVPRLTEVMRQKGWDTDSLFLTDGDRNRIQID